MPCRCPQSSSDTRVPTVARRSGSACSVSQRWIIELSATPDAGRGVSVPAASAIAVADTGPLASAGSQSAVLSATCARRSAVSIRSAVHGSVGSGAVGVTVTGALAVWPEDAARAGAAASGSGLIPGSGRRTRSGGVPSPVRNWTTRETSVRRRSPHSSIER